MSVLPTESNIAMSGAGLIGKSGSGVGRSGLLSGSDVRTLIDSPSNSEVNSALAGKSNTGHGHTSANISDFSEAVDDRVAALLEQGSNVTIIYNDETNRLTISASSGGGGASNARVFAIGLIF